MRKRTSDIIPRYHSINNHYSVISVFIISENLSVRIDQVNSSLYVTKQFFDSINQSRATRHPSQLNGRNYRVRHILCRRTPPPPKLNLPLINFGVLNFFVDLGPSPVSWTVVPRFNRVGSYVPANSTLGLPQKVRSLL